MQPIITLTHLRDELRLMGHTADPKLVLSLVKEMGLDSIVLDDLAEPRSADTTSHSPGCVRITRGADASPAAPPRPAPALPFQTPRATRARAPPPPPRRRERRGAAPAPRADRGSFSSVDLSGMSLSGSLGGNSLSHSFRYSEDSEDDAYAPAAGGPGEGRSPAGHAAGATVDEEFHTSLSLSTRERLANLATPRPAPSPFRGPASRVAAAATPSPPAAPGAAAAEDASLLSFSPAGPAASPFRGQGPARRVPGRPAPAARPAPPSPGGPRPATARPAPPSPAGPRPRAGRPATARPRAGEGAGVDASHVSHLSHASHASHVSALHGRDFVPGTSVIHARDASVLGGGAPRRVDRVAANRRLLEQWSRDGFLQRNGAAPPRAGPGAGGAAAKRPNVGFAKYFELAHREEERGRQERRRAAPPKANAYVAPGDKRRDSLRWQVRRQTMGAEGGFNF